MEQSCYKKVLLKGYREGFLQSHFEIGFLKKENEELKELEKIWHKACELICDILSYCPHPLIENDLDIEYYFKNNCCVNNLLEYFYRKSIKELSSQHH